jgi:glycosyltransferase involved in cell wall biosynthesis
MPVHGPAPFLRESALSVINQDLENWELILVLDRPTEELTEMANSLVKQDKRIKKLISPGTGIVDALNFGLMNAKSELIARLDSDDIMERERLSVQSNHLLQMPEIACVGTQMSFIDETGKLFGGSVYPTNSRQVRNNLMYQNCVGHPSVMYRKKQVLKVGSYRKILTGVEDYDLWLRLIKGSHIENLDQRLTRYRLSAGQYSKSFGDRYTTLEEAARLDSLFTFINDIPENLQTIDTLSIEIKKIRKRNFLKHPVKVSSSYQGYFVSRIIRIASTKKSKVSKFFKCIPFAIGLLIVAPRSFISLLIQKLKGLSL